MPQDLLSVVMLRLELIYSGHLNYRSDNKTGVEENPSLDLSGVLQQKYA